MGNHTGVIGELSELVAAHPVNENLVGQYLLALYRCGRGIEALECFRRTRKLLHDELGATPSPRLAAVQRGILAGDRVLLTAAAGPVATVVPRQLPSAPAGITGREALTAAAGTALAEAAGVIAFVGPGGAGKTALALTWAHALAAEYPDGQLFADLRGYSGTPPVPPERILTGFLRALGVKASGLPGGETELAALFRSTVAGRRILIVADNAAGADQLLPLLPGTGDCLTIVTSRDRLTGLSTTPGFHAIGVAELSSADSQRVLAAALGVAPDPRAAGLIARLAEQCGNLPLALRLAAGQLSGGTVHELSELVDDLDSGDRLATLAAPGDTPGGVAAAIETSYRVLAAPEQRMFRLLGLHPGGPADPAALAAMAGTGTAETDAVLDRLSAAHLATRSGDGCWLTHDLVAEYASRLDTPDSDRRAALGRMLDWYLAALLTAEAAAGGKQVLTSRPGTDVAVPRFPDPDTALSWLDSRYPALLAATALAGGEGFCSHAVGIATALTDYCYTGGRVADWLHLTRSGLDAARRLGDAAVINRMHVLLGSAYRRLNRGADAVEQYRQALAVAKAAGDTYREAVTGFGRAYIHRDHGEYEQARAACEAAIPHLREHGDVRTEANLFTDLALLAILRGDYDAAKHRNDVARDLSLRHRLGSVMPYVVEYSARIHYRRGDLDTAAAEFGSLLSDFGAVGEYAAAMAGSQLGLVESRLGRHDSARRRHLSALAVTAEESTPDEDRADALNNSGMSHLAAAEPAEAVEHHREALFVAERGGIAYQRARAHHGLSLAFAALGDDTARERHWHHAITAHTRLGTAEASEPGHPMY